MHQLNILVNNAGVALGKTILETSLEDLRQLMGVNLDGVFLGTKYAITLMQKTVGSSIINIASIYGINSAPNATAYCASKGGIRFFTSAMNRFVIEFEGRLLE